MSPNPMGWRPTYANQFQQALKRRVSKGQQGRGKGGKG